MAYINGKEVLFSASVTTVDDTEAKALAEQNAKDIAELQEDVQNLELIVGQTIITETEVEDTFSARQTAGGLDIIDGAKTQVKKIVGNTVAVDGKLANATFGGIKSTSADGTQESGISLAEPIELAKFDMIDVDNKQLVRQTVMFNAAERTVGYAGVVDSSGVRYVAFTFGGTVANLYDKQYKETDVVSSCWKTRSVWASNKVISLGRTAQNYPLFNIRDDDLLVFNEDGTVNKTETINAFKAFIIDNGVQLAYKPSVVQSTEAVDCPKEYVAYNGGQESVEQSVEGADCTITQTYIVKK